MPGCQQDRQPQKALPVGRCSDDLVQSRSGRVKSDLAPRKQAPAASETTQSL
jgi:hypothetical protein